MKLFLLVKKINPAFILFATVGFLTAVIYLSLFTVFWKWLHINYKISLSMAYTIAVIFQFFSNRNVTFKSQDAHWHMQAIKFCCLLLINYVLTMAIVTTCVNQLDLSPYLGIILSVGVTVVTGFFLSKFWIFKKPYAEIIS